MTTVSLGDFIELRYTGKANGIIFDSNKEADLKELNSEAKATPLHIIIGQRMVVPGLDSALEGKEIGKEYQVKLSPQQGFGPRHASLVRPIPLKVFAEKNIQPRIGMSLLLDQSLVQVRAISGARVMVDFNNPLAGKDLEYTFTITKKIDETHDKARIFFERYFRIVPEFDVSDVVKVKGPKILETITELFKDKFKTIIGKELVFELVEKPVEKQVNGSS